MKLSKPPASSIVSKCARLMDVLASSRSPMTFTQIVESTGFVKSSCHRLLAVLVGERLVTYDKSTRTYRTGERLNEWSRLVWRRADLQEVAGSEMVRLSEQLSANVALSVMDASSILYLRTVDHVPVRYAAVMGDHAPLHCTAAGKVFLANMTERKRKDLLSDLTLNKMTERTLVDLDALDHDLLAIRQNGYGLALEEEALSVFGIAAPVWGEDGTVAACLSIWMVSSQPDAPSVIESYAPHLQLSATNMSKAMGWTE